MKNDIRPTNIANPDKYFGILFFLRKCEYSLETPHQGRPDHSHFCTEIKKNIDCFGLRKRKILSN